jgi:hypothetical protein
MSFKQKRSTVTSKTAVQADISSELEVIQRETVSFPSSSGQLFAGYCFSARGWKFGKSDLIDARDRQRFETTPLACYADAYPFQIPLKGRTGPEIRADGADVVLL